MKGFQYFSDHDLKRFTGTELRYDVQPSHKWLTEPSNLCFHEVGGEEPTAMRTLEIIFSIICPAFMIWFPQPTPHTLIGNGEAFLVSKLD